MPLEVSKGCEDSCPVEARNKAFARCFTGDSDILSSCDMKDDPAFKPEQVNLNFFRVRTSRCPFHLRQHTQVSSHITIAEGILLFRCLWKVGFPLQSKPGNQLSTREYMGCMELSSICYAEIDVPLNLRRVSQGISGIA